MKKTVGVIGNGFVGETIAFAFSPTSEVKVYDVNPLKTTHTLNEVMEQEFIFICFRQSEFPGGSGGDFPIESSRNPARKPDFRPGSTIIA